MTLSCLLTVLLLTGTCILPLEQKKEIDMGCLIHLFFLHVEEHSKIRRQTSALILHTLIGTIVDAVLYFKPLIAVFTLGVTAHVPSCTRIIHGCIVRTAQRRFSILSIAYCSLTL